MAIVNHITHQVLERESAHSEAECTYHIGTDSNGHKYLQLDTYGSEGRQFPGKKSQSIRLSKMAIEELKSILANNGL